MRVHSIDLTVDEHLEGINGIPPYLTTGSLDSHDLLFKSIRIGSVAKFSQNVFATEMQ